MIFNVVANGIAEIYWLILFSLNQWLVINNQHIKFYPAQDCLYREYNVSESVKQAKSENELNKCWVGWW